VSASDFEFPPAALFSTVTLCPWREKSPRIDGALGDWSDEQLMPPLGELAGEEQFASLWMAWNERGLYLALSVPKHERIVTNRESPSSGDAFELFIDTRGARTSHRASQFCYHLVVLPAPPGRADGDPVIIQRNIRRALQRSQPVEMASLRAASRFDTDGYAVELAFEPDALHGYEPRPGLRIGLAVAIHDIQLGRQLWGASPDAPYERDPSTWGILEPNRDVRSAADRRVEIGAVDLVMVPGVAFDSRGGRLGHGKGYYDKLLAAGEHTHRVAVAFECQMFPEVPMGRHDVRMHAVVTEAGVYR